MAQTAVQPPGSHTASPLRRALRWAHTNLFSTWYNTVLTLLCLWVIYVVLSGTLGWAIFRANWAVIPQNLRVFLAGTYPSSELWRIWAVLFSVIGMTGLSAGAFGGKSHALLLRSSIAGLVLAALPFSVANRGLILGGVALLWLTYGASRNRTALRPWIVGAWFLSIPGTMLLMWGAHSSQLLPRVETTAWGGFTLTLLLAIVGILASFPIGLLLALGRRSTLRAVSIVCTCFIEVVRGMPLVTILFMAHLMVPIFMPDVRIDKVVRAMIGLTLFTSAYMAENIRGGLQGVPQGQVEAAHALGMNASLTMLFVVLPQAIRSVIPSIVGQFISLFKDTSLVAIIGLLDLLGVARSVMANPDWLGLQAEVYLFAAFMYWLFSFSLSKSSRRLERALGVNHS